MACIDASVLVASLLPETLSEKADLLIDSLRVAGEPLIAPSLLQAEISSALRNAVFRRRVSNEFGEDALTAFQLFPIEFYDLAELVDQAWSWAKTVNAPRLYDMFYVALASREGCDLWTADRRLLNLMSTRFARIRWVEDVR